MAKRRPVRVVEGCIEEAREEQERIRLAEAAASERVDQLLAAQSVLGPILDAAAELVRVYPRMGYGVGEYIEPLRSLLEHCGIPVDDEDDDEDDEEEAD